MQSASASISAKGLSGSFSAEDKVYDGSAAAAIKSDPAPALDGVVEGDQVSLDGDAAAASFADKHVGEGKVVTATGFELVGPDAANYTLTMQSASATITPKGLAGSFSADDKVYDGTAAATIKSDPAPALDGVIEGDDVSLNGEAATASFADKQVGQDKLVTATGFELAGPDAANYTLTMQSANADITPKGLTGSFSAVDKVYDGSA